MITTTVPNSGEEDVPPPERLRWAKLVLVVFGLTVCFMLWSVVFPLLPLWTHVFNISPTQEGLLAALFSLPGFFVSLPAGWLLDRYPSRYILGAAWLLAALGTLLMAMAPSFWTRCAPGA
jgi:predicted MFS family arabinose efflux permease